MAHIPQDRPHRESLQASDIASFVNRDLAGYENLDPYDFTSESGNVYSVPMIDMSDYSLNAGMLSSESPGMVQYFIPYPSYDKTAKEFIQWYVYDDYYSGDYSNPVISDAIVSEDKSIAAAVFSYDDSYYGSISMVYVAVLSDDGG